MISVQVPSTVMYMYATQLYSTCKKKVDVRVLNSMRSVPVLQYVQYCSVCRFGCVTVIVYTRAARACGPRPQWYSTSHVQFS